MALSNKQLAKKRAKANARKKAKAKANVKANIPNITKGKPFEIPLREHIGGVVSAHFDLTTEFKKMHSVVTGDIIGYDTRSNKADFDSLNWGNDGGFFMAVLPTIKQPQGVGFYSIINDFNKVSSMLNQFKTITLDDNWTLISCFCTPDYAWKHLNEIADTFRYAYIGYSTMHNLAPLAEDRDMCIALKKGVEAKLNVEGVMA